MKPKLRWDCIVVGIITGLLIAPLLYSSPPNPKSPGDSKGNQYATLRASSSSTRRAIAPAESYELTDIRIIDGDTIEGDITITYDTPRLDLPLQVSIAPELRSIILTNQKIRLIGANAYETSTVLGKIARTKLRELVIIPGARIVYTPVLHQENGGAGGMVISKEKYGRLLGSIRIDYPASSNRPSINLADWLITNNYGVPYDG